jgi:hypothetical protein
MIRIHVLRWVALAVALAFVAGCGDDNGDSNPAGASSLVVPGAYVFDSRFNDGESSVSYSGQVVRNLLLQDLKSLIGGLAKDGAGPITVQDLLDLYDYNDGLNLESRTTAGSTPVAESYYSSISTGKNLVGKISGDPVIGYNKTADELMREWFEIISENSQDAGKLGTPAVYTTDEGVDLNQMVNKVLIGAVPYYQATGVYMNVLFDKDNGGPRKEGNASTAMEHAWDEAFGYFGAARDYGRYSDIQLAGSVSDFTFDSNSDGKIDFNSEYNFGLSRNAGKRDKGGTGVDFTGEIFTAFLTGRAHIANQSSQSDVAAQREAAANGMEKVIAATVVHYVNDTLSDMSELGTASENKVNLNKHWAEMKGFAVALQYNPFRLITDSQLRALHAIMGQAPAYDLPGTDGYETTRRNYGRAKVVLQEAYGFSQDNMDNW